ncbi:agrin-like [Sycon ciliatum]|uniref:agrin-like n=1 Tax=Sycon ciliatum TaxID=27933 RepID=UPI0031F5F145
MKKASIGYCALVCLVPIVILAWSGAVQSAATDTAADVDTGVDRTVVEIPLKYYDQSDEHMWTDHFVDQLVPVRRENTAVHKEKQMENKCLNVTCHPEPNCAEYRLVHDECCARCMRLIRRWRTCPHCEPTKGCLKYAAAKRGQCCAECSKRKNRQPEGLCASILCPPHRVCREVKGEAMCMCKERCPSSYNPVCGFDGITYKNPCHRKRAECASGAAIPMRRRTACH